MNILKTRRKMAGLCIKRFDLMRCDEYFPRIGESFSERRVMLIGLFSSIEGGLIDV